MSKSYAKSSCRRYLNTKCDKEKSENVTNFYVKQARLGRSDETYFRNRTGDYGRRPHGPVGMLPLPVTGMIRF